MVRFVLLAVVLLVLSGCSLAPVRVSSTEAGRLDDASVTRAIDIPVAGFAVIKAYALLMGPFESAIASKEGAALEKEDGFQDPAIQIGEELVADLATRYHMQVIPDTVALAPSSPAGTGTIEQTGSPVSYVVVVQTRQWNLLYYSNHPFSYRVIYRANFQLIDTTGHKTVAQATCKQAPDYSGAAPTYDEITARHGLLLKQAIDQEIAACVAYLKPFIRSATRP